MEDLTPEPVRYPEMRARLRKAVDALCDTDRQERFWLRPEWRSPSELDAFDSFNDTLLFVVDEMDMSERPDLVGDVLVDESELSAFRALVSAIESLIAAIGTLGEFADALASGTPWESCVAKARELQQRFEAASS